MVTVKRSGIEVVILTRTAKDIMEILKSEVKKGGKEGEGE